MKKRVTQWGQWLRERSRAIGIGEQKVLAAQVGCSREHISRLFAMAAPPKKMRRGLDASLARALQTSREMLFDRWQQTPPEEAPRTLFHPDQFFENNPVTDFIHTAEEDLLKMLVNHLLPSETENTIEYVVKLVLAANDGRAVHFRAIADRFKMFDELGKKRRIFTVRTRANRDAQAKNQL